MKKIIKTILYSIFWRLFLDNIKKVDFIKLLNNLSTYLKSLSFREQIRFVRSLFSDSLVEKTKYLFVTVPLQINLSLYFNTLAKKLFFFGFIFSILASS
jgi:hypothetical protein